MENRTEQKKAKRKRIEVVKKTKTRQSGKAKLYKCDKCDQNCIKSNNSEEVY